MGIDGIESHERMDIETIDIPGAYLHTDTYEHVTILLKGRLANLIETADQNIQEVCYR